jgi:diguanylate cyclase (GGDEF)-like protein
VPRNTVLQRRVRLSLTAQVALLSLVPILALGFLATRVLQAEMVSRSLADADQSAQLVARLGIQPSLTPAELRNGLSAAEVNKLGHQLRARSASRDLARIKIWNTHFRVIYSDDHQLIGRTLAPSDDLVDALRGNPDNAEVVSPTANSETATEVGLGRLVEVYVPMRFAASGPPMGAFEIYLSYGPIGAAIARDRRMILFVVFGGLALLRGVLLPIVARASRKLLRQSRENERLARRDPLTDLPNRMCFSECVSEALREQRAAEQTVAVLLVDLDGFREINDALGHPTGDALLAEVGQRLRGIASADGLVARLSGDEFAVLVTGEDGLANALDVAGSVNTCLEAPFVIEDVTLNIEASIGLAAVPQHAEGLDALLQCADVALRRAKTQHSRVESYSPEYDSSSAARLELSSARPSSSHVTLISTSSPRA